MLEIKFTSKVVRVRHRRPERNRTIRRVIGVAQLDTILDYMGHWAAVHPDKCFSVFLDRHGEPRESYTYQSFEARTRFLAEYIHDETALQRGDRVALVYPPGLEMVAAFVACARIGAIPVPVPPVTSVANRGALRLR